MSNIEMIDNTEESINKFHELGWGERMSTITREQLQEFIDGKVMAIFDGEYTHVIKLED